MARREVTIWLLCLALLVPVALYYGCNAFLAGKPGLEPTGFLVYDHMIYMAHAREQFDVGFHPVYGNPASPMYDTPRLYSQPTMLLLGLLWKVTGLDLPVAFALFGVIFGLLLARAAVELYEEVVGFHTWSRKIGFVLFFWGGGIIALTGFFDCLLTGKPLTHENIFMYDPGGGGWCLSFGRNLISPLESAYHLFFYMAVLYVCRNRFRWALLFVVLTSLSHPFTGMQLLVILAGWAFFERSFMRSEGVPRWFFHGLLAVGIFHVGYYIVFLKLFREHAQLVAQWSLPWMMSAKNFIPAYFLVGLMSYWSLRTLEKARGELGDPRKRLFLLWFVLSFMLASNQFALSPPVQPLHFTRGYIWTSLFLLGSASLIGLLDWILARKEAVLRFGGIALVMAIFLLDNGLWFTHCDMSPRLYYFTRDEREVIRWMNGKEVTGSEVLSLDLPLNYHTIIFTPLRAWAPHVYNTPFYTERSRELIALFQTGALVDDWKKMPLLIVFNREITGPDIPEWVARYGGKKVFENGTYTIFQVDMRGGAGPPQEAPGGEKDGR